MSDATFPLTATTPFVGVVIRERSLRIVVLPAPLGPMIPRACFGSSLKLTSFKAQNSREAASADRRVNGRASEAVRASRIEREFPPRVYRLLTFSNRTAAISNDIREGLFHAPEIPPRKDDQDR
ncbi:MAG: hypothetical protein H6Q85_3006 [candidate division NC10 bacterium]|nr:hypothetical protein [candidate division NC10 bacterium]